MSLNKHTQAVAAARGDEAFGGFIDVPVCRTSTRGLPGHRGLRAPRALVAAGFMR